MRKFDPWSVFFKREWIRNWPFLVGFATTGTIITKFSLGLSEEDAKNSRFVQRHKRATLLWHLPLLAIPPFLQNVQRLMLALLIFGYALIICITCILHNLLAARYSFPENRDLW